jgi:peptide chain release factor subunit 1
MFRREEVTEMTKIKARDNYFVSCYLNVDPASNSKGDYVIHIKNMLKSAAESAEKSIRKKIVPDIERIENYIFSNKREFKKGLVIISSVANNFWKDFHFSLGLKNEIVIDRTPYIKPLVNIIDRYQKYAVMLIDKESARLFAVHLGEIEEYGEVHTENVPGKHKKGGWFSLSERSFERHIDYHVGLHIKDVIGRLQKMVSSGSIGRLVIGGPEEALSKARAQLTKEMSDKLIGTFNVDMDVNSNEVLSKVQSIIERFENKEKNISVDLLLTKALKNENAVLGIDDVLAALREGRVRKLLFIKDHKASGYSCQACGFLTSQKIEKCPYCSAAMQKVDYIIDLAAQKAIDQGASCEVVYDNEKFEKAGSIGALLRY